jgi:valyl-tRNA synthetase
VLDTCLRLLHPYIPFVTEETWQQLKQAFGEDEFGSTLVADWPEALIIADWPVSREVYRQDVTEFERLRQLIRAIRSTRSEYNVEPGRKIAAVVSAAGHRDFIESQRAILTLLSRLDDSQLLIADSVDPPQAAVTIALGDVTVYLPLAGLLDIEKERDRLQAELADLEMQRTRISSLLASEFASRAPAEVVVRERDKLAQIESSRIEVESRLSTLE